MAALDAATTIEFLEQLTLDTGARWVVEPFQRAIIEDIAAGAPEIVVVIPEGNAKTTLMAGVALAFARQNEYARIPLAAASRDQAGLLFGQAADLVRRSGLEAEFRVYEGYRKITHQENGAEIKVFAADDRTGDGAIFDIAFCDELHRMAERGGDMRLWRVWRGKLDKRGGQIVGISTAGSPGNAFEEMRDRMRLMAVPERDGRHSRVATADAVLHEWSIMDRDDPEDMRAVKLANPLSTITEEKLARRRRSPSMTPAHWLRFVCNLATSEEGAWLPAGAWEACFDEGAQIPDGGAVWLGVDVGLRKDHSAVVLLHYAADERLDVRATVFDPPPSGELDMSLVEEHIRGLASRYEVLGVAYDPWNFTRSAQLLEADGLLTIEHPMTNARMVPASQRLYEAIVGRRIRHDGDPVLAQHVAAGQSVQTERGWRIGKKRARLPQDALVALCLAFGVADVQEEQGVPVLEWI